MISWIPTLRRDSPNFDRVSQHSPSSPSSSANSSSRRTSTGAMGHSSPLFTIPATPSSTMSAMPQRLEQLQQHSSSDDARKLVKNYHIVPHDVDDSDDTRADANDLCEPLYTGSDHPLQRKSARSVLASSRVQRDQLLRKMEELIMKEAELASAYELFDYTRKRCSHEHESIVGKLARYEELLRDAQAREAAMQQDGVSELLQSESERERWRHTQNMVATTLPELLARLEDNIDLNSAKIRSIQDKMEAIRAHRLAVREEIALKEEDIALALQ